MKKRVLYFLAFLIKGWEVSLLLVLPILQTQNKISIFQLGIIAATFSIFQITMSLFSSALAEKFKTKRVMTSSLFFYGLSWSILALPISLTSLLLAYCLGGIATGMFIPLANSQIAKISDKNRAKELGDFSAFTDMGRVVLTALTAFLIGNINLFIACVTLSFSAIISTGIFIKSTISNNTPKEQLSEVQTTQIQHLLKNKGFLFAVLIGMFDVFASASLFIFIPLLLIPKGIDVSSIGLLSALFFVGYLIGRLFLGRLADKYGASKVLIISEIFMAALILCLVFINDFVFVAIILFVLGIFTRGTSPVIRAMMADAVGEKHKFDKAFSIHSFALNSSNVTSRTAYGFLASLLGITSVFYLSAFIAIAALIPIYLYNNYKLK